MNYFLKYLQISLTVFLLIVMQVSCDSGKKTNEKKDSKSTVKSNFKAAPENDGKTYLILNAIGNSMMEMAYEPNILVVKAGTEVHLTLINKGEDETMQHNVLIVKKGKVDEIGIKAIKAKNYIPKNDAIIAASEVVPPLGKSTLIFQAPEVGEYAYVCTYPGHYMKMRGRFVVVE